jgi:hypothetical protein
MSFQNLVGLSQIKTFSSLIMLTLTKCQKMRKKRELMSCNMMIGYDIWDRFTMAHFTLRQRMTLTTKIYCYICLKCLLVPCIGQ